MLLTSMSEAGFREYGHRLIAGLQKFAPGTRIMVYSEDHIEQLQRADSVHFCPFYLVEAFDNFDRRHSGKPELAGRVPMPGWKEIDRQKGYCFRFDAIKFCRKVFAIADAARRLQAGTLTWIDADAVPLKPIPPDFFEGLGAGDCMYLGRERTHSECGFLHFRLPGAMPLIQRWEAFYASDGFLNEREWHDSFLFDLARGEVPSVACTNIATTGRGHVWVDSPLGPFFDHLKGLRKSMGYSPERIARGL